MFIEMQTVQANGKINQNQKIHKLIYRSRVYTWLMAHRRRKKKKAECK